MVGEWREIRVGDLVRQGALSISDGYRVRNEELGPEGVPFVRGGDIGDGWINTDTQDRIKPEFVGRVQAKLTRPGDAAFITKGTVGRAGWLRPGQPSIVFAPQVAYWRVTDRDVLDPGFVFYLMRSYEFQSALDGVKTHGAMAADYVSISQQYDFRFRFPGVETQRAIAHILGALDDKIELNRRMNETLEAMARAVFQSWFVDFDPVLAKAEGRANPNGARSGQPRKPLTAAPDLPWPGAEAGAGAEADPDRWQWPQHILDLFPARLVDSELGEIPEGWEVGRFGDVVEQLRYQENPLSFPDALYHHFSIPAFDDGQTAKAEFGESIKSLKSRVPPGVILMSKLNPEIERVWMVDVGANDRAVCSTEFLVLRARPPFTRGYIYCLARSPLFRQLVEGLVTGTSKSHQRAQLESILNLPAVKPPARVVATFDRSTDRMLARTLECRREGRTLAALRDALLPKLISGELRVADAEKFIGRVA